MRAGELGDVVLAPIDVGYIRNITLTLQLNTGFLGWLSSRSIEVESIMVERIQNRNT